MVNPEFFLTVYLPGWVLGMALCAVQGHYEHAQGTISYYGCVYNLVFFNDGLHAEHHARPREHWTQLSRCESKTTASRWPPVLRWLSSWSLEGLERILLRSKQLQRFVLGCHERAFVSLLSSLPDVRRVGIVGGGLFPRTAVILRKLLPDVRLVVIDMSLQNLDTAAQLLPGDVDLVHATFDPKTHNNFDLLVFPLSFKGDDGVFNI